MTQSFTYGKPYSLKAFTWHKKNSNVFTCKMGHIIKECDTCMENSNIWMNF